MRALLQHQLTHLYLTSDNRWTAQIEEARDFGTSLKAMDFVQRSKVERANIVLNFDDPKYDIILEIMAQRRVNPNNFQGLQGL